MNIINNFLLGGGDERQIHTAEALEKSGYTVKTFYLPQCRFSSSESIEKEIESAQGIILPLPVSRNGTDLFTVTGEKVRIKNIVDRMDKSKTVFGGMFNTGTSKILIEKGIRFYDYFEREEVSVLNSAPTAQGVLKVILNNTDRIIQELNIAVFGYGRTGKTISDTLIALKSSVTVCVRKYSDIACAQLKGMKGCLIKDFLPHADKFDFIINTVPSLIINSEITNRLKSDCIIIDIASAPYGTDFSAAEKAGIKALLCPSLPGKTAPATAGSIIAQGILNIIMEEKNE